MKKLIVFILMILPIYTVKASDWIEVDEIPEIEMGKIEIKEEKEYLWYKLRREGDFYIEAPSDDFVKTGLWKFSEWSNWSTEKEDGDVIETRNVYHYQNMKKIKFIRFSDFSSEYMIFDSIDIYKGDTKISYQRIEKDGSLIVELDEPCYYDELEIRLILFNVEERKNTYTMEWLYELELPSCMSIEVNSFFDNFLMESFSYRLLKPNEFLYEDELISLERVESNLHRLVRITEESRSQNRIYYYEKEWKDYNENYSAVPIGDYLYPDWSTEKVRYFIKVTDKKCPECVINECPKCEEKDCEINECPKCEEKDCEIKEFQDYEMISCPIVPNQISQQAENTELKHAILEQKEELENIRSTLVSCLNEKSNQLEKDFHKTEIDEQTKKENAIQKQSFELSLSGLFLILGFLLGRIMPTKKKV